VKIHMPPLRERREDIVLLADAFLKEFAEENAKPVRELTTDAIQCLIEHPWPGNVRELRTAIEHGVVMSPGLKITLRHLPASIRGGAAAQIPLKPIAASGPAPLPSPTDLNLAAMEERMIHEALNRTGGNRTEAATLLGLSRRTLQRRLREIGLT